MANNEGIVKIIVIMGYSEGMAAFKGGDYEEAAHQFVAVTEKDDQNHKAWNALGICLSKTGQYEAAHTCLSLIHI